MADIVCEQCKAVFEAKRSTARFCSDRCRKAAQRLNGTVSGTTSNDVPLRPSEDVPLTDYWPDWRQVVDDLPIGVSKPTCRPDDTESNGPNWWNAPEYARTIERLLTWTVEELEADGIFVPCWKYNQAKAEAVAV